MFLVLACSCLCSIYWRQVLSGEWRCSWSSADRRCSNYIWVINNLIAYNSASYIRDLTVLLMHGLISLWSVQLISTHNDDLISFLYVNFISISQFLLHILLLRQCYSQRMTLFSCSICRVMTLAPAIRPDYTRLLRFQALLHKPVTIDIHHK